MLKLAGCRPEPLANYLKALGVLRLVAEQKDPQVKGFWQENYFRLVTELTEEELEKFFLEEYVPTPLISPWNGSTGFYPKDNKKTINSILDSGGERFAIYRQTIEIALKQVQSLKLQAQPKDKEKQQLIAKLRNTLPDLALKWLDTCALVSSEDLALPPLMGTGGNDGNFEFSRTYQQQLGELFHLETGEANAQAPLLLKAALFNFPLPQLNFFGKIGQFNPIASGGANAAPGYEGASRVNSWDYILMLEGTILFAAGATRRYESTQQGSLAAPFTVRPSNVGYGSAAEGDKARAEIWVPLWSKKTGLGELKVLFGEGRAKVRNGRVAKDGVDFALAVSSLGVQRGIKEFIRYSFQERNGLSYFAFPLGRFSPQTNPQVDLLTEIDLWLSRFRRIGGMPASLERSRRRLETVLLELSQKQSSLQKVLITLAEVEAALNRSLKFTQEKGIRPVPLLSEKWLQQCQEDSVEFRLALSLASNNLRPRLVRVRAKGPSPLRIKKNNEWLPKEKEDYKTTWQITSLSENLINWLRREAIEETQEAKKQVTEEAQEQKKSRGKGPFARKKYYARLDDIVRWLEGQVDEVKLESLARGLSLIDLSSGYKDFPKSEKSHLPMTADFALLAVAHHRYYPQEDANSGQETTLPRIPGLLNKLASGNGEEAINLAIRRLRASGLRPALNQGIAMKKERAMRLAAALAFPLDKCTLEKLLTLVQEPAKEADE